MQQWIINEHEARALDYLTGRARTLYVFGLRRYMDYSTGIVGEKRKISLKGLSEVIEERPERGSKNPLFKPTRDQVISTLICLERNGLIEKISDKKRFGCLIFKLTLASTGSVRLREEPYGEHYEEPYEGLKAKKPAKSMPEGAYQQPMKPIDERPMNPIHQVLSGIKNINISDRPVDNFEEENLTKQNTEADVRQHDYPKLFESFWQSILPIWKSWKNSNVGSKVKALAEFKKLKPDEQDILSWIHAAQRRAAHNRSAQTRDQAKPFSDREFNAQFPHVCRWLRDRYFEEVVDFQQAQDSANNPKKTHWNQTAELKAAAIEAHGEWQHLIFLNADPDIIDSAEKIYLDLKNQYEVAKHGTLLAGLETTKKPSAME